MAIENVFIRDAVDAVLNLFEARGLSFEEGAEALRKARQMLDTPKGVFGASWRLANSAMFLADRESNPLRLALTSAAYLGYLHCVGTDSESKFRDSLERTRTFLGSTGAMSESEILRAFATALGTSFADSNKEIAPEGSENTDSTNKSASALSNDTAALLRKRPVFSVAANKPLRERFEDLVKHFPTISVGQENAKQTFAEKTLQCAINRVMAVANEGRTFTEFDLLQRDLNDLSPRLLQLDQTDDPRIIQERARQSRALAESIDFGAASPDDYRFARAAWLLSAFWNSQLSRYWPASQPNVVYDLIGYLTTIQAELRYSDADFLVLLRVSFSICRIASHDGLMPYQFLSSASDRLQEWIQHTVGTILVTAGPGRVSPSRVVFDPRVADIPRRDYGKTLLKHWTSDADRAAAATMLLEMGAWDSQRSKRILTAIHSRGESEFEVWGRLIDEMAGRAKRVRVVRPNPWSPGSKKPITVEHQAVAVLAADVVARNYQVLEGDVALKGHDFRERRVPTYVCSAEFGPLGLFKLDAAERISREVENFAKYAQRLHPRYRASRCDHSKAVITEPDDEKEFVQGALTSYVFTEDETPKTLNTWFNTVSCDRSTAVCEELFQRALRPWYGHATSATIDIFAEFPVLDEKAIDRLIRECRNNHGIALDSTDAELSLTRAITWISSLLTCLKGECADPNIGQLASELQVLRSYRAVCHGDLHMDNVLVIGKNDAEYPCVIDFEATHEGYILKDFGRFVAAAVTRTFQWDDADYKCLKELLPPILLDWTLSPADAQVTEPVRKILNSILAARKGILRAWQAGSYPCRSELVASLTASFLPFARYPDTLPKNARFAIELSSMFVASLDSKDDIPKEIQAS